jgi:hypothetical protein
MWARGFVVLDREACEAERVREPERAQELSPGREAREPWAQKKNSGARAETFFLTDCMSYIYRVKATL